MSSNDSVNDGEGFDAMSNEMRSGFSAIAEDISRLDGEILNVRAALEAR